MPLRFWRAIDRSQASPPATVPAASSAPSSYYGIFNHLSPATIARGMDRLRRLELFSAEAYVKWHHEVLDGVGPYEHAFRFGMFGECRIFDEVELARQLARPVQAPGGVVLSPPPAVRSGSPSAAVYVSTRGNLFMREIAGDLVRDLNSAGMTAELRDETSSIADRPPVSIFMAPHEFFILGDGWDWVRDEVLQTAIMFGTEQPQTGWFAKSLPFLLMAAGAIDLCDQTVGLLRGISVPAFHLVPGVASYNPPLGENDRQHPLFRVLPAAARMPPRADTAFADRPIDIAFFGAASLRRQKFFAQHAATLADYQNVIYLRSVEKGPLMESGGDGALTRLASHVAGHAKITLNIHQSALGYFEWHRIVRQGMAAGSLVVSDTCLSHGDFKPGVHYLEAGLRQIPNLVDWLLRSPQGALEAERVRGNAQRLLAERFSPARAARPLVAFLDGKGPG